LYRCQQFSPAVGARQREHFASVFMVPGEGRTAAGIVGQPASAVQAISPGEPVTDGNRGTVAIRPGPVMKAGHLAEGARISLGRGKYWYKSGIQNLFFVERLFLLSS
jgi:hypothetical protein